MQKGSRPEKKPKAAIAGGHTPGRKASRRRSSKRLFLEAGRKSIWAEKEATKDLSLSYPALSYPQMC